jgi:hypothetical protein
MRALIPDVVTPLHVALLRGVTALVDRYDSTLGIRLDGGTALSAFYLGHRESEDLDFMVTPSANCRAIGESLSPFLASDGITLTTLRASPGLYEGLATRDQAGVRVQLLAQSPFLLEPPEPTDTGARVTAWRDVVAGKLHAIADRTEPRDFVDLHCILDHLGAPRRAPAAASAVLSLIDDLRAHDPGLSMAAIGRALAAGGDRALYDGFPLRMLKPVSFADVAATASCCAAVVAEELAKALRRPGAHGE